MLWMNFRYTRYQKYLDPSSHTTRSNLNELIKNRDDNGTWSTVSNYAPKVAGHTPLGDLLPLILNTKKLKQNKYILPAVSKKNRFCKILRFSKSGFATFSNDAGCQKWPALSEKYRRSVMMMATKIKYILTLILTFIL